MSCSGDLGPSCFHNQVPTSYGFKDFDKVNVTSSYTFNETNEYEFTDATLSEHTMSIQTHISLSLTSQEYALGIYSNQSYTIFLPDTLNYSITVSPDQNFSLNLPCNYDGFTSQFTCEVISDDPVPSWISVDCDNSLIEIQGPNEINNISSTFSVKSTHQDGEIISQVSVQYVT